MVFDFLQLYNTTSLSMRIIRDERKTPTYSKGRGREKLLGVPTANNLDNISIS